MGTIGNISSGSTTTGPCQNVVWRPKGRFYVPQAFPASVDQGAVWGQEVDMASPGAWLCREGLCGEKQEVSFLPSGTTRLSHCGRLDTFPRSAISLPPSYTASAAVLLPTDTQAKLQPKLTAQTWLHSWCTTKFTLWNNTMERKWKVCSQRRKKWSPGVFCVPWIHPLLNCFTICAPFMLLGRQRQCVHAIWRALLRTNVAPLDLETKSSFYWKM